MKEIIVTRFHASLIHPTISHDGLMAQFTPPDSNRAAVVIIETPCRIVGVPFDGNDHITLYMVNDPAMADTQITVM